MAYRKWRKKPSSQHKQKSRRPKGEQSSRSDLPGIYISIDELGIDLSPITLDDRKTFPRKRSPK